MAVFRIPKQTDESYVKALLAIRDDLDQYKVPHEIYVRTVDAPWGTDAQWRADGKANVHVKSILEQQSSVMPHFWLRGPSKHNALIINRKPDQITDEVQVAHEQNYYNGLSIPEPERNLLSITLISSARKHLRSVDAEATFLGTTDSEWDRFRNAQSAVLASLNETQRSILSEFTRKSLEMEASSKKHIEDREAELQQHYDILREQLNQKHNTELERLVAREKEIEEREKKFNTKEARYVARSEQQKQIDQIKGWLEGWSLTKGTRSKRVVVIVAYLAGVLFTGALTVWFSKESMGVIEVTKGQLAWWQWALLAIKSIFPLAAFITLVVAFIRWSTDWAKQHSDEEFRNRARILDIGRTAWLLEAVRDAQDNNKELPPELLKELSRNLFAYNSSTDIADLHPQAVSDTIMQGLNSLRVKTPDGSEIEAKRGKA